MPAHMLYAQTASILPPAKTTFFDNNGKPLVGGKVEFYVPGGFTQKMTWQDAGQTTPNTNPVKLDAAGRAIILGDGSYRQIVKDKNDNIIWDQVTSSTGSGGGGGTATVGDGDPVGMIKVWGGFVAPYQYAFAYGQEFNRASYPELYAAITSEQNITCTIGSPTLTSVGDTSQLPIGSKIESSCLNPGSTIASKTSSTVTANTNAIISSTTSARFFPYGNGDGSLTFNLPDLRGRVVAGRDNMGGIAANRLTTTYFANASGIGVNGGSESFAIAQNNLPNIPFTFTGNSGTVNVTSNRSDIVVGVNGISASGGSSAIAGSTGLAITSAGSFTPSGSISPSNLNGNVTTVAISRVQPTQTENYIIKILPDSNPNTFFGVASIGGMTGVITCGFGITCAGNNISAITSTVPTPTPTTLGGIFQSSAPSLNFAYGVDTLGNILYAQPGFGNLAGTILPSQIANNTITNAMLNTGPALSVVGNNTNATANRTDIAAAADGNILRRSGTAIGFGSIDLSNSNSVGSSLLALANGGCNAALTASNGGVLWSNATQCQILAGTANAGRPLLSGANATPSWAAFSLPGSVTSGGVPYFSSTSAMGSSAVLGISQLIIGGGAGAPPVTLGTLGTTTTVLHGNAAGNPTFGPVSLTADVSGVLPAANLPTATAAAKGIVQGDGSTLTITAGTISCTTGSSSQLGCLKPDGTTITSSGGTLTAVGAVASSVGVGTTTISGGTSNNCLYNNAGVLGDKPCAPGAILQASPADKSGTASLTQVMLGNGSSCTITPTTSGRLLITLQGASTNSITGNVNVQIRYGTGAAPSNGAAATGTAIGSIMVSTIPNINYRVPMTLTAIATGLSIGTTYWIDAGQLVNTGTGGLISEGCTAMEF